MISRYPGWPEAQTPATKILATVLHLEVLRWQPWLAVTMPYPVGKETFQWYFLNISIFRPTSEAGLTATFEHWDFQMSVSDMESLFMGTIVDHEI